MRILLVNANREQAPQPPIPLGLCLVASSLKAQGFQPRLLDLCFSRNVERDLIGALRERGPELIGLSVRNLDNGEHFHPRTYLPEAAAIARLCREHSSAPLVIGGPAVSIAPIQLLDRLGADYAVVGDGEQAMVGLAKSLTAGALPAAPPSLKLRGTSLAGVYWKARTSAPGPARVEDLDSLPLGRAGEWLDLARYLQRGSPFPIQSKRGCSFECIYCTYRLIEGPCYRLRSPAAVAEEIEEAGRRWRVRHFEFVDSTFNHPLEHALALCEAVARKNLRTDLHTMGLNPAAASRELLPAMKRAGFRSAICTPESGSPMMLESLRKGFTLEQVAQTADWAKEAGLPVMWAFLFGGPGESEETVRETLRFIEKGLGPQDRIFCTVGLRIYPGTELERLARSEGLLSADADLADPAFYFSPRISSQRILALLESSERSSQMMYLETVQRPLVALALRLKAALHLPGADWAALPLYNRLNRLLRRFNRAA